mmetsp:Transcript_48364/g.90572  ORF Transcript_48364/g.90572 Transcript_48364/m.90572 type:complete len:340 (-) Transcript_48364:158-1177(-)
MAHTTLEGDVVGSSKPADGNALAEKALLAGIEAVLSAMSGEVRFTNENEAAFALLRKGCRHCAGKDPGGVEALRQVSPEKKAVIVAFLGRIAESRRLVARRVQELGAILAQSSPSWQELLAHSEPLGGPNGLLAADLKELAISMPAAGPTVPVTASGDLNLPAELVLEHEARIFLRERGSQRYLSIVCSPTNDAAACIMMTELPVSLFVCYMYGKGSAGLSDAYGSSFSTEETEISSQPSKSRLSALEDETLEFGLAHEGIPGLGRFLGSQRRWTRRWTEVEFCCSSRCFGKREIWSRGSGASLQHQSSGKWLYVDPSNPDQVILSSQDQSAWEVLAAV